MLEVHSLGIGECLAAVRAVFGTGIDEGLLLRSLTFFEDADRQASLPGEGPRDWSTVKEFFRTRVGHLLLPPPRPLVIQERVVDARGGGDPTPP
jgi:hypothetical protein